MDYTRTITPNYETIGRRKKFTGVIAELRDGETLLHSMEYANYGEAECALDAIVYDLLMDLAERGLSDTAPTLCQIGECVQVATHTVNDTHVCCFHYSEEMTGILCGCPVELDYYVSKAVAETSQIPILNDVARVLDMALGSTHGAASVVAELQRVRARIGQVQECTTA